MGLLYVCEHRPPILLYAHPFLLLFNSVVFPGLARTADEDLWVENILCICDDINYLLRKLSNSFMELKQFYTFLLKGVRNYRTD